LIFGVTASATTFHHVARIEVSAQDCCHDASRPAYACAGMKNGGSVRTVFTLARRRLARISTQSPWYRVTASSA
jgi:hypothetical protein